MNIEDIITKFNLKGKEVPRWLKNELKYEKVTLRDRIPGPVNKNDAERRQIDRDYQGV